MWGKALVLLWGGLLAAFSADCKVQVVESSPKGCLVIGEVVGSSGYGKNANWRDVSKTRALRQAERLGATHAVVREFRPQGAFNGISIWRVFRCPP